MDELESVHVHSLMRKADLYSLCNVPAVKGRYVRLGLGSRKQIDVSMLIYDPQTSQNKTIITEESATLDLTLNCQVT